MARKASNSKSQSKKQALEARDVRPTAGDNPPPLAAPLPPGIVTKSPVPPQVEAQAQKLIHEAGSCDAAKTAVDVAAEREHVPDFQEDHFALRWGFASRADLRQASQPLATQNGNITWGTELPDGRWICWSKEDMSANETFSTLEDLQTHVQPSAA